MKIENASALVTGTADCFNRIGVDHLPGRRGIVISHVGASEVRSELPVHPWLMAPNGFLHAASVIALADTSAGSGCVANLPKGLRVSPRLS